MSVTKPQAGWTCDRCRREMWLDTGSQPSGWVGVITTDPPLADCTDTGKGGHAADRQHLCPPCGRALKEWLREPPAGAAWRGARGRPGRHQGPEGPDLHRGGAGMTALAVAEVP